MALAAGRLGTVPLAAQSVIMTTDQVLNTIPFGIGVAASTRFRPLPSLPSPPLLPFPPPLPSPPPSPQPHTPFLGKKEGNKGNKKTIG